MGPPPFMKSAVVRRWPDIHRGEAEKARAARENDYINADPAPVSRN
jgi:hypothetical protein